MAEIKMNIINQNGGISMDIGGEKIYPALEDLEVTPSGTEQNFTHPNSYGYDKVKVGAVASDTLDVTPSEQQQQFVGLYGSVNVDKIPSEYVVPSGTKEIVITENGTTTEDVTDYASAEISVNIPFEGLQLLSVNPSTNKPTAVKWHGDTIPAYGLYYSYYAVGTNSVCTIDLSEVENLYDYALGSCGYEFTNTQNIKYINSYGMAQRVSIKYNDLTGKTLSLDNYTGYGIGGTTSIHSIFRSGESNNFYGTILCPKIEYIPMYAFYNNQYDLTVQLGSIGYPVKASGDRPFGGSMTGTNTVTVYTTGNLLDTIKTTIESQKGSATTFIYKAAEQTTYGGTTYNAGDTILTSN